MGLLRIGGPNTFLCVDRRCLDEFVIFGERHLLHLVGTFVEHYLTGRYHQGLGGRIIKPTTPPSTDSGAGLCSIRCRSHLGGLLNYYYRQAA